MSSISLVFPHQLFEYNPILKDDQPVYLIEEQLYFRQYAFHKQKLVFHRAGMKAYETSLTSRNDVRYIETSSGLADVRTLVAHLGKEGVTHIHCVDPVDDWLTLRLKKSAQRAGIEIVWHESPQFLNSDKEIKQYFPDEKRNFLQTNFYIAQRKKRKILVNSSQHPSGGKWSFDVDNRKRYPKGKIPPVINLPKSDEHYIEAIKYVDKHFPKSPGELSNAQLYPYTFNESKNWFSDFLKNRFANFGDYEDAIVASQSILNHSVLTPLLNVGLLTPQYVINSALTHADEYNIPINSVEGFIRQLIGWREFIRGMYITRGIQQRTMNKWKFQRKIPPSLYNGTTGIEPVDHTIKKILKTGYCHHIERLMVLGNFMFLCNFHPDEVYRWFMELFIDAYDWVMVPNVYGMSQFSDGGMMATKPYISGSNYILKMSDYKRGDWCEVWDALYWMFIYDHQRELSGNPRMSLIVHQLENKNAKQVTAFRRIRDDFFSKLST